MYTSFATFLWTLISLVTTRHLSSRIVTTKYGALRGSIITLPNHHLRPVEVFLGIPYATAPVGSLRFMPPVTPPHWKGVRNADKFGPVCPQRLPDVSNETEALRRMPLGRLHFLRRLIPYLVNQSEDCLYLNIYIPFQASKLPVLVFIHGESYEWNSGNPYDGSVLASFGSVVVITINFRLGVLGFLPSLDNTARGNYGLMDQVAALHWIQENISQFGGDHRKVTIFGHDHGAACINILMISPMARGLFNRVILQSGSALSSWATANDAVIYTRKLAHRLSCPTRSNALLVECLRQRTLFDILKAQPISPPHSSSFGPTIDGIVLPFSPAILMKNATDLYGNYDMLFGITRTEFYHGFSSTDERSGIDKERRDSFILSLVRSLYTSRLKEIFLIAISEYTDWTRPTQHPVNMMESIADVLGDALIVAPIVRAGMFHSIAQSQSYLYVFTYQTERSEFPQRLGCIHGEEQPYVFGVPLVGTLAHFLGNYTQSEVSLSEGVMTYWTNFAKTGDPNLPQNPAESSHSQKGKGKIEGSIWPSFDPLHQKYLTIGMKPKVRDHYHAHRLSFWNHLFPKLDHLVKDDHQMSEEHSIYDFVPGKIYPATSPTPVALTTVWSNYLVTTEMVPVASGEEMNNPLREIQESSHNGSANLDSVVVFPENAYSTALSVTIAVGCTLLILNALIFAGVFYQRDKTRMDTKLQDMNYKMRTAEENDKQQNRCQKNNQSLRVPSPTPLTLQEQEMTLQNENLEKSNILMQERQLPEAQPLLSYQDKVISQPNQEMRVLPLPLGECWLPERSEEDQDVVWL